jgi:SAM-dependent methyltransferase
MEEFRLLIDLHRDGERQGPGGAAETELALRLSGLSDFPGLRIADIGCGTGSSTRLLARKLQAHIIAVDFLQDFLEILEEKAEKDGTAQNIETLVSSMEYLPFSDASLDAIWSEGAIYNIGFSRGINEWRRFIKPGGIIAVTEITWLTNDRPEEIQRHWENEYPDIATASTKIAQLEDAGYKPVGYFALPPECWLQNYYMPMQSRFEGFLARYGNSDEARKIVEAERAEIDLYERYSDHISYGFYIAQRLY